MSSSAPPVTNAWMLLRIDVTTVEHHRHAQEQLRAFEEHGGPEAIPALAQLWGERSWPGELRQGASAALAGIVGRTPVQALPRVDEAIRARDSSWWAVRWDAIRPAEVPALVSDDPHPVVMLGLLGCHHQGYVREAAVRALAERREGLPWLLLRVNDWVAPIRIRASTAVSEQLDAAHADAILESLPLLWRLPTLTRYDHHELVARAKQVLGAQPSSFLRRALVHEDRHVRRAMMRLLVERGQPVLELAALGLDDVDPVVRMQAARLVALDATEAAATLRERLCRDSQGRLRALGLEQQVSASSEHAAAWLERGLVDPHRSVRELARHLLGKQDPTRDFAAEYRARLAREAPSAAVAAGLGETGIPSDWEHLVPALDVDARTAREALVALRRLDAASTRELRLMMVDDPRPSVSREAARLVGQEIRADDEEVLREYLRSPLAHVRRNAMRLVLRLPEWRPGMILLSHEDTSEQPSQEAALSRWLSLIGSRRVEIAATEAEVLRARLASERWREWSGMPRLRALLELVDR